MSPLCPACNQSSRLLFRTRDRNRNISADFFPYYRCTSCDLIYLSPIPNNLGTYYPNDYYSIPTIDDLAKAAEYERYKIEIVNEFISKGKLLEIGPAYGSFLYLAKKAGFDVEAIEMDARCCKFIREKLEIKVVQTDDPVQGLKDIEHFDVITLWHVIEHLPDPWGVLKAISDKVNAGGILVIAAPNPQSFQFKVLGRYWPHVDAPRHLSLIPLSLLINKARSLNFKPIMSTTNDKGTLGWNTFGWVYFFSNLSRSSIFKTPLGIFGNIVSVLLGPLERRRNLGSGYTVVFKKELV